MRRQAGKSAATVLGLVVAAVAAMAPAAGADDARSDGGGQGGRHVADGGQPDGYGDRARVAEAHARLNGFQEDPLVISTPGQGHLVAWADRQHQEVRFRLDYKALSSPVREAHIHLGGRGQSGGVIAYLCSNVGGAPVDTQKCPPDGGSITGTLRAADVIGPAAQGIEPGELDEVLAAAVAGVTYVNVHTERYPDGEIRGQLEVRH